MNLTELVRQLRRTYPQEYVPLKHVDHYADVPIFNKGPRYLFRGEPDWYPETVSSKDRLLRSGRFTADEIADLVDCGSTLIAELAMEKVSPFPLRGTAAYKLMMNEIHSWVQHYGIPLMSIDLTRDLNVAAFFAAHKNTSSRGRIYVFETAELIPGNTILQMDQGYSQRARNQKGYALRMWDVRPDLQNPNHFPVQAFEFAIADGDESFAHRTELLSTKGDDLAAGVIAHLQRARPKHSRVAALVAEIRNDLIRHSL